MTNERASINITFPISRDPPEGGTHHLINGVWRQVNRFQFLGIPPKGELYKNFSKYLEDCTVGFQFLGIPPKGERKTGQLKVQQSSLVSNF